MDQLSAIHRHHDLFLYSGVSQGLSSRLWTYLMIDRIRDSFIAPVVVHFLLDFLVSLLLPIKLHSLGPTVMFIIHDVKVPFAATTQVSVKVFVVAAKVEAPHVEVTAVSVSFQFVDLFKPSVLLQLQHRGACCR